MALNPVVAQHLKEAHRELVAMRDTIDRDIAQLEGMLGGHVDPATSPMIPMIPGTEAAAPAPPMKEAIVRLLSSQDRPFTTNEVAVTLRDRYGWQLASTRSQMSRMGKAGEIDLVSRGVYRMWPEGSVPAVEDGDPRDGVSSEASSADQAEGQRDQEVT